MYCNTLVDPLITKIEIEKKTLDQIAAEVCGNTVKNPRQKIIRIIKLLLGNKYLIKHAQTLGYHTDKAVRQKSTTDEVVKGKILTEEVANEESDNSGQTNSVTPECQRALQAHTVHEHEAGETKGQEQALEVYEVPTACCRRSSKVGRKVRKTDSENKIEGKSGEKKGQEQVLEEQEFAPVVDVNLELLGQIKGLIERFSLKEVRKALEAAESDI